MRPLGPSQVWTSSILPISPGTGRLPSPSPRLLASTPLRGAVWTKSHGALMALHWLGQMLSEPHAAKGGLCIITQDYGPKPQVTLACDRETWPFSRCRELQRPTSRPLLSPNSSLLVLEISLQGTLCQQPGTGSPSVPWKGRRFQCWGQGLVSFPPWHTLAQVKG